MEYKVIISPSAEADMGQIAHYIARDLREPDTALNLLRRFRQSIADLRSMPERYPLVRDDFLAAKGVRSFLVDNYLVFYMVSREKNEVNILNMVYGKREWADLLSV